MTKKTTATKPKTTKPSTKGKHHELFEAKLASSGLTLDDAKALRMSALSPEQTVALSPTYDPLCAMRIDYLGIDGKPINDWPGCEDYVRIRYLEEPKGFDNLAGKSPRYVNKPNTLPVAYYPGNADWKAIAEDVDTPLIITEGELKAAKACKEGFPTIGIGGVWNWKSAKHGIDWLRSLDLIKWPRRNIYLCFDSDVRTNASVNTALVELAEMLVNKGAFPHLAMMPELKDLKKVGLDDFFVHSPDPAKRLRDILAAATPLGISAPLWELNKRFRYIHDPGLVINTETLQKMNSTTFKESQGTTMYQEQVLMANGTTKLKPTSAAAGWLSWPLRAESTKLTYEPGHERLVGGNYNMWPGWGVEPQKGDVKPFLQLLDHLFTGAEPGAREWFMQWLAYPLQHPGAKLLSSVAFHGIKQGTGKSLVGITMGRIYGQNYSLLDQQNLNAPFNEWAEAKQFVLADEVTGSDKRAEADRLKGLITQPEMRVNRKFVPSYSIPDCINYFFTSNQPDAFFLDDNDRRFFVHEIQVGPLSEAFYRMYDRWYKDDSGPAALFHHLLHNVDTSAFNPNGHAFRTLAKERMIVTTQSDLGSWVRQLRASPDEVLRVGSVPITKDLFTSKELLALYDPEGKGRVTANGVSRELQRAGVRQVYQGRVVKFGSGNELTAGRYFAVRNDDKWLAADFKELREHLEQPAKANSVKQKKY